MAAGECWGIDYVVSCRVNDIRGAPVKKRGTLGFQEAT